MRPSLRLFGAELIDASRRAEFPLTPKPGIVRPPSAPSWVQLGQAGRPSRPPGSATLRPSLTTVDPGLVVPRSVPHQGRAKIFFETVPTTPRVYPQRKAYLFGRYKSLLQNSKVMLVFQNNNLSSEDLSAVKAGVYGVKKPEGEEGIIMEMIRGGILSGAIKKEGPSVPPVAQASRSGLLSRRSLTGHASLERTLCACYPLSAGSFGAV
jgi:hypothetical protein